MPSMHLSAIRRWILQSPPVDWIVLRLRELLISALKQGPVPQHVAFVMDGNRRFARQHGIETVEGHHQGFEALAKILEVCYKSGVKVVTIYAFSVENFKRSKYEVDALMDMAKVKLAQLAQHEDLMDRYGARIRVLGQRELVKPDVLAAMDQAVELTARNGDAILNICIPYTSHAEMTNAIRQTVADYTTPIPCQQRPFSQSHIAHNIRVKRLSSALPDLSPTSPGSSHPASLSASPPSTPPYSDLSEPEASVISTATTHPDEGPIAKLQSYPDYETITPQVLDDRMYTAGSPPVDLLIRTSGVVRLSDFMLWQVHEDTQIRFLNCLWPDFDLWSFLPVLVEWQWTRRHGSVPIAHRKTV